LVSSYHATVSDASHRIIYLSAKDGNGDGHGNFGFKVNDGTIDSKETTVTVNVTSQPEDIEATAQTVTADEDIIKTITLAGTDKDGDALTYNITTLPANGTLFQTSNGTTRGDTITSVPTTVSDASHRIHLHTILLRSLLMAPFSRPAMELQRVIRSLRFLQQFPMRVIGLSTYPPKMEMVTAMATLVLR